LNYGLLGQLQSKLLQYCPGVAHTASTVAPCLVPAPLTMLLGRKVQQHHWSTMSVLMCVCFRACMLLLPEGKWQAMHTVCMQAVLKVQSCAQEGDHLVTRQIQLSAGRSGGGEEEEKGEEEGEEHRLCNWMPMQTNGRPVNTDRHRCVAKSSSKVERQHTQHRFCGGEVGPQLKSLSTVAGTGVQQRCDSHHGVDMIHSNL
jgi:hypothetical protein